MVELIGPLKREPEGNKSLPFTAYFTNIIRFSSHFKLFDRLLVFIFDLIRHAFDIEPFLILEWEIFLLIATKNTLPIFATLLFLGFNTLINCPAVAPELSAIVTRVNNWSILKWISFLIITVLNLWTWTTQW